MNKLIDLRLHGQRRFRKGRNEPEGKVLVRQGMKRIEEVIKVAGYIWPGTS